MWQTLKLRFKEAWVYSWTTALGWAKIWAGVGIAVGSYMGHVINDPGVQAAMTKVTLPSEIGLGLAVLGAIVLFSEAHA